MKRFFYLSILSGLLLLGACSEKSDDVICTEEFRYVTVKFKNKAGDYIQVENFKAVIKRTDQLINQSNQTFPPDDKAYVVVTDTDKKLLAKRDTIVVNATDAYGKPIAAEFVIATDACHITKILGPEEILVD